MKIKMARSEALLADIPESSVIDFAESVGVSSSVPGAGCPVHLRWLAPGPGCHCGGSKQAILVMLRGWLPAHISPASPSRTVPSRPATATTSPKHIV